MIKECAVITTLKLAGAKLILELDPELLKSSNINPEKPVKIVAMGDVLTVTSAEEDEKTIKLRAAMAEVKKKYGETLKRLAK